MIKLSTSVKYIYLSDKCGLVKLCLILSKFHVKGSFSGPYGFLNEEDLTIRKSLTEPIKPML